MATARLSNTAHEEKVLQRSSSKAEAIRRGTIRISGPIPLQSEIEDEALAPDRSVVSLRVHEAVTEKRSQLLRDASGENMSGTDPTIQSGEERNSVPPLRHERSPTATRDLIPSNGYASSYGHPYSMYTERNSMIRTSPKSDIKSELREEPRRKAKGGSFRNAVRKLFGRKPKVIEPSQPRHGYHRSDPGGLLRPTQGQAHTPTPQRSFSMPLRDISPSMALQSHAPALQFPRSKELKPLDLSNTIRRQSPRRRATLGTSAPSPGNSATLPKSYEDPFWDSAVPVEERDIGLAVTSGSNPKRRSRSAGALRDMNKLRADDAGRRRSDEIRYWRASVGERPLSGESGVSGIAVGGDGPERRVNSMHYRDASDEHPQPLSPRHARIFDFGPLNESRTDSEHQQSPVEETEQERLSAAAETSDFAKMTPPVPQQLEIGSADATRTAIPEKDATSWVSSPSIDQPEVRSTQNPDSTRDSGPLSTEHPPVPKLSSSERLRAASAEPPRTPVNNALKPRNSLQERYYSGSNNATVVDEMYSSQDGYSASGKGNEKYAQTYADDYVDSIRQNHSAGIPSPLSPNTSMTFEAVSNVLAHERAARKDLERLVHRLMREVTELRSVIERRTAVPSYMDRGASDDRHTYHSRSSETMDATRTLERLEGHIGGDSQRVTVIRSRFSGFDSVDESNGGTNEDDDRENENEKSNEEISRQQQNEGTEQTALHYRNRSAPSIEMESPSSEAFETPTEEASGYDYAYDEDDVHKALPTAAMRIPIAAGGMF
ncbi:MAG: hypothetical protein M1820_000439 [Bogoriella megaspora]|nr:MAG: hypothetical protein M1820_000439 [Bogoriella megaspora]